MSTEVIVAIITGVFTLAGVIATVVVSARKQTKEFATKTDLMLYRIGELEKKQDQHNRLIERMYKVEDRVNFNEKEIDEIKRKITA